MRIIRRLWNKEGFENKCSLKKDKRKRNKKEDDALNIKYHSIMDPLGWKKSLKTSSLTINPALSLNSCSLNDTFDFVFLSSFISKKDNWYFICFIKSILRKY